MPGAADERKEHSRDLILAQLAAGDMSTAQVRVAFILNHYPDTRDSDKLLTSTYWRVFQRHLLGTDRSISDENVMKLENPYTIIRYRQKIQNEYMLFQASERVRQFRQAKEIEIKEEMLDDKPGIPMTTIYCDESGKTGQYALVGSIWIYNAFRSNSLARHLSTWKSERGVKSEFHFSKVSRNNVEHAKAFFMEALARSEAFSFKAVSVERSGVRRAETSLYKELHYQLIHTGLVHEFETGRVAPPQILQLWKDKEDGEDKLVLNELRQDVTTRVRLHFGADATVHSVEAVDSKANTLIQLADLFAGTLNRLLNPAGEAANHKDELARYIAEALGLRIGVHGQVITDRTDVVSVTSL